MSAPVTIPKNQSEVYRIEPKEFKGHRFVDLRVWYLPKDSEEYRPTGKGVAINPDALGRVIAALTDARQAFAPDALERVP